MSPSQSNRNSIKGSEKTDHTGNEDHQQDYKKLPDKKHRDEDVSTAGDSSDPKYSRTNVRKEDKEKETET